MNSAPPFLYRAIQVELPDSEIQIQISEPYLDLAEVFTKAKASTLPLHGSLDSEIDLLPGDSPPCSCACLFSVPEAQTTDEYIKQALALGYIYPSTSLEATSFFFIEKTD